MILLIGTITTIGYCVTKDGKAYEGTKAEIVNQIFEYEFDESGVLLYRMKGYKTKRYGPSWNKEYTEEERQKEVISYLFDRLRPLFKVYRDIGY